MSKKIKKIDTIKFGTDTKGSTENFENLYNLIYKFSKRIKQKINYNSDELWEYIITDIPNSITVTITVPLNINWNNDILYNGSNYNIYGDKILMLPEYFINGKYEQIRVDKNHYFIQIIRIPNEKELTYETLMKLAMYNGLLSANLIQNDFPEGIVKLYKNMHLFKLSTYINNNINLLIDSNIIITVKNKLSKLINGNNDNNDNDNDNDNYNVDNDNNDE